MILPRRREPYCRRCHSSPRRLAWLIHNRNARQVLILNHAARRSEVDQAGPGNVDQDQRMGLAAGPAVVVTIVKMQISVKRTSRPSQIWNGRHRDKIGEA
jgi:hypothetical protein